MNGPLITQTLFALQCFQVFILLFHDFIPLPPLNDVAAAHRTHGTLKIILGALVSSLLPGIGLALTWNLHGSPYPLWLALYLLGAYGFLFMGEIEAWWATYLFGYKASERAHEYHMMYGRTAAFLPKVHGIVPNALHVILHLATVATLALLAVQLSMRG